MTPKAIVDAIETRLGLTGVPCQVRDAIEVELLTAGLSPVVAADRIDGLLKKVIVEISRRQDECRNSGEISVLRVRGEVVSGSSFVFTDDPEEIKRAKVNRTLASKIYAHVQSLTYMQFERFGRSVLRELGCKSPRVTPHKGDQGIDFYGDLSIGGIVGVDPAILKLMHEVRVILVGQAKHYPNGMISTAIIRELVGALSLSRTRTYSRDDLDLLDDVELCPFSPVLALIFTTGKFTKGARHLAKRAGLIAFSGLQLAVFLADKGVGLVDDGAALKFDCATFDEWLE